MTTESLKRMTTTSLVNTHSALFDAGDKVGLDGSLVLQLLLKIGPDITKLLLEFLEVLNKERNKPQVVQGEVVAFSFGYLDVVKALVVKVLLQYREELMSELDKYERLLFDKIIEQLSK